MNAKEYEMTDEDFSDYLTEIYGTINVCGYDYDAGRLFKEVDPIAFGCSKTDHESTQGYQCGECDKQFDHESDAEECCKTGKEPIGIVELDRIYEALEKVNTFNEYANIFVDADPAERRQIVETVYNEQRIKDEWLPDFDSLGCRDVDYLVACLYDHSMYRICEPSNPNNKV